MGLNSPDIPILTYLGSATNPCFLGIIADRYDQKLVRIVRVKYKAVRPRPTADEVVLVNKVGRIVKANNVAEDILWHSCSEITECSYVSASGRSTRQKARGCRPGRRPSRAL